MLNEMLLYIMERSQDFTTALGQHLSITFMALGISIALGMLLGIIATRIAVLKSVFLFIGNTGRTIPSLAVMALALPLLGIGRPPTILALVFIGTLPVLVNTTLGIEQVSPQVTESARGMGMSNLQILLRIEIPIATSVIMAGIRTAAVLVVASTTLAAFIGGGGLGDLILRGHALSRDHIVLAGAIPATLLAFYFEETFGRLEYWATPKGLKIGKQGMSVSTDNLVDLLQIAALLPLVFGFLLPWVSSTDAEGAVIIQTGLHPGLRNLAIPSLFLGLLAALWPAKRDEPARIRTALTIKLVLAVLALVLSTVQIFSLRDFVTGDAVLGQGPLFQFGSVLAITVLAFIDIFPGFNQIHATTKPAE